MSDTTNVKLSFREKFGYSLGDAGANFVFQMMIVFQTAFYTDVMGIGASAVAWMLLLVRFSDAITDPIMGAIADRTNTRWGKFRPWLLWSAIPFALLFVAAYSVPDGLSPSARLWYSVFTYTVLMMAYTMNNAPYSALNGVMTSNSSERTSLSQYRFFSAMVAAFVVQGLTLPLVNKLGDGDDAKGWMLTISLFATIAVVFFVITFFSAKERVEPPKGQKPDLKQDFKDISKNVPWIAMFCMTLFVFITLAVRGGSQYYYFTYFVDSDALTAFVNKAGLFASAATADSLSFGGRILDLFGLIVKEGDNPTAVGFSLFNMTGSLVNVLGVLMAKPLADRFGKKTVFMVGLAGAAFFQASFFFVGAASVTTMFALTFLTSLCYGPTIPLLWAMIADCADWGEWKNNRRATGFVFAGIVFALKGGLGIGGAITGWLLAMYGYPEQGDLTPAWMEAIAAQGLAQDSAAAKQLLDAMVFEARSADGLLMGYRQMIGFFSGGFFFLGVICMFFYPISKQVAIEMSDELEKRRIAEGNQPAEA
ncbi:MFS transporter [Actomonas aquatica]|uniref:Glycoside-pentoside-hexuronide (GPH):cation symporter n=1 Tax=Actomonas aquatica TaxID=2866162 RepID=A0ABZ1C3N9_9BACT|nr:glycoside-pentoside-hexuronide (GPH):cation symporter [Opitutus sp. WL0086]WRQ85893.1 glycoside-pentoside-hexuronide (GPH):cation symporter [Opitutus sp. WL0086]